MSLPEPFSELKVVTKFQVVCPECGHVGLARWTKVENIVICRRCKEEFDYRSNTYRPVTGGMTDEERAEYYRIKQKEHDQTPARKEYHRQNARRYYYANREKVAKKQHEYYLKNKEKKCARERKRYYEHREEITAKNRERYRERLAALGVKVDG